jgi:hypothetical protein
VDEIFPARRGGRRVIISLDLADGDDDREWHQANKRREWRSGFDTTKVTLSGVATAKHYHYMVLTKAFGATKHSVVAWF